MVGGRGAYLRTWWKAVGRDCQVTAAGAWRDGRRGSVSVTDDDIAGTFTFVRALEDNAYDPMLTTEWVGEARLNYIVENRTILWWCDFGISARNPLGDAYGQAWRHR